MKNLKSENNSDSIHQDGTKVQCARMQIVFVHGWGMNSAIWDSFIAQLPETLEPVCVDLLGHGEFNQQKFTELQEQVDHLYEQTKKLEGPVIWVGWSLGVLPILEMARQFPQKVSKLVMMAASPCFVTQAGWNSAVDESVFDLFANNLQQNIEKTLQRFLSLQVQGMEASRDVLRELRAAILSQGLPSQSALMSGLNVLKTTDLRDLLSELITPQLWLLGAKDTLVPASLNDYLSVQEGVRSHIIDGSAHLPFISHSEEVMQQLLDFIHSESIND